MERLLSARAQKQQALARDRDASRKKGYCDVAQKGHRNRIVTRAVAATSARQVFRR
jgi:uncharacterized protein YdbL (DUF1318 family)